MATKATTAATPATKEPERSPLSAPTVETGLIPPEAGAVAAEVAASSADLVDAPGQQEGGAKADDTGHGSGKAGAQSSGKVPASTEETEAHSRRKAPPVRQVESPNAGTGSKSERSHVGRFASWMVTPLG